MARRLLDAATAAGKCSNSYWMQQQPLSWSDLEDNSDDEEIIDRYNDASSIVRNQTASADDELTVSSGKESDSRLL